MKSKLTKQLPKSGKALRKDIEELGRELGYLQRKCREYGIPVLVVVEGLSAAGKGTIINNIIQPLDPVSYTHLTLPTKA